MTYSARDSPWSHSGAGSRGSHCLAFAVPARGQCTEKQRQLNHHKGFPVEKQRGHEGSLSCSTRWVCKEAAFSTFFFPDNKWQQSCALCYCTETKQIVSLRTQMLSAARRERAWVHPYVCVAEEKSSLHSKNMLWVWNPLDKRRINQKVIEKKSKKQSVEKI